MTRSLPRTRWLVASAAALVAPCWVVAQDDDEGAFDRTPQDCLNLQTIADSDVIDDQNIIFRLRNDRVYRNTLPRKCPGLDREERFMYETRSNRLCSIDTITVLEQFGVGFTRGFTCRLGEFVPLSPAEVEDLDLLRKEERPRGRRGIEARPVEAEPAEPAAPAEPAPAAAQPPAANE